MVPHSSSSSFIPASPTSTPDMPGASRSSTCGTLEPAVSPGTRYRCPTMSSSDNITVALSGTAHVDCSLTRDAATGKPLDSSSPGTNGLHASTTASNGALSSLSTTRPNGYVVSKPQRAPTSQPANSHRRTQRAFDLLREHFAFEDEPLRPTLSTPKRDTPGTSLRRPRPEPGGFQAPSRGNWPRPPNPTEPVPIPPNGNDTARRCRPSYTRSTAQFPVITTHSPFFRTAFSWYGHLSLVWAPLAARPR